MADLKLPSGHVALVDDDDSAAVLAAGPWHAHKEGRIWYVRRHVPGSRRDQKLHKFLTGYVMTDHANGDGMDNRRANLRPANASQNQANRTHLNGRSGYRGVTRHRCGKWQAVIKVNGRGIYLGLFDFLGDAARAYDAAAIAAWGEYARPNFPRQVSA